MLETTAQKKNYIRWFLFLIAVLFSTFSFAQLKADFTVDKVAGCSPLTVIFKNTTTGASSNVVYK